MAKSLKRLRLLESITESRQSQRDKEAPLGRGISVARGKVPYTLGGWSVSTPSPVLQQADGPFIFARDHLTYLPGWQAGAVVSGLNALGNLLDLVG